MDDSTLALRIQAHDRAAMETLVERFHRDLYRFLRHLTRRVEDAEDLTQQTLLRAIAKIHQYDPGSPMKPWLFGIAFREFNAWRRRRVWLPLLADRPCGDDPFGRLANAEALLAALAKLSPPIRAAFLLHHVEELSVEEVGAALDIPSGTVKSRLHTARAHLRTLLTEETAHAVEACRP